MFSTACVACKNWHPDTTSGTYLPQNTREASYAIFPIGKLRSLFAAYGIPEELVSDNGPQFTSEEFSVFMKNNGIKHTTSAPYQPATNGAAERMVQILKQALKSVSGSNINCQTFC